MAKAKIAEVSVELTGSSKGLEKATKRGILATIKYNRAVKKELKSQAKAWGMTIKEMKKVHAQAEKTRKAFAGTSGKHLSFKHAPAPASPKALASRRMASSGSGGGGGSGFIGQLGGQAAAGAAASFGKAAIAAKLMAGAFGIAATAARVLKVGLIASVNEAAKFEEQFQVVKAITTGTSAEFKNLEQDLISVSVNTEHTTDNLLKAAEVLGRAGFEAKDVGKALETVADLATAGGLSVAKAADLAVRMLKAFNKSMDELPHVADMLAKASASANVSIQSLGEGFKFTGAIARSAGLKFSDVTTALSLLGETGLEAGLAGRALQAMIMDLSKPTDDAKQALFEMGVVTHDVEGNMLSLSSILTQLNEAQMTNADAFEIFNRNSARAATALGTVTDKYVDFQDATENATGSIGKMGETIRDSLNKNLAELKNNLKAIGKDIGDQFLPSLNDMTNGLADFLKIFSDAGRSDIVKELLANTDLARFMSGGEALAFGVDEDPEKRKERKKEEAKRKIAAKKAADAAEKARQLSAGRLVTGDPLQGGEKGFIGAAERFTLAFQQILVEGEGALASANLAGKVKTIFSNIFTELARTAGIGPVEARKAAVAGQKEFMKSQAFLNAQRKQNVVLERIQDEEFLDELLKFDAKERQKVIEATKKRLDLQVKQNAELTAKTLAINEKAFKEIDNILQRLPEKFKEELEALIVKGTGSFGGIPTLNPEMVLEKGRDLEKQAGVDELIDEGAGIMEVFDAAMELKSGWTTAFFMAKKLALDFYDTVENSFLAVSGEIGGIFVNMVKGMASGGPLAAIGTAMMSVLQKSEAFQGFMETAGEILGVLANALNPFVEVISSVMVPVLKVVARILLASFTVLAVIWNAIAGFLNLFGANIQTIDIGDMWSSFEDGMDNLGNSVEDTTDKFDDLNTSLTGIAGLPDAIKLNLLAFREAMNSTRAVLTGSTSASPGHMSGPIRMHTGGVVPGAGNQDSVLALLTPGEQVIPAGQSAGDGTNVQIGTMVVKVTDVKDFVKKLNDQQEWRSMARSGSLYGKGVVGSR